jgi:signal peptidase I
MTRIMVAATTLTVALTLTLLAARRWLIVVRVEGASMAPSLCHGDRVLVRRARSDRVRTGQLVVLAPPPPAVEGTRWLVKRAVAVPGDPVPRADVPALQAVNHARVPADRLVVLGDNAGHSYDSRKAGYFTGDGLLGVVVRTLRPGSVP